MIRLIASDMDGTLLDSKKRLPAQFLHYNVRAREGAQSFTGQNMKYHLTFAAGYDNIVNCISIFVYCCQFSYALVFYTVSPENARGK